MQPKGPFLPAILVLVTAALTVTGYWLLFSNFALYDDESYILLSAREYYLQGSLYDKIYSQYGPASYVLMDGFQRVLGAPVDHTIARLLTLVLWLGTAGYCALLTWRQTSSRSLCLFTLTVTFLYLYFITDEPFHPGSLICFILAASLYHLSRLIDTGRLAAAAIVAGAACAILFLTKINVGVFYFAGICGWTLMQSATGRRRSVIGLMVLCLSVILAVGLMHALLQESWVQIYLVLFTSGVASSLLVMERGGPAIKSSHVGWFLGACAVLGAGVAVMLWLRGTTLSGMIEGVLLGPLRHPARYSYAVDWRPGCLLLGGVSLILALLYPRICRHFGAEAGHRLIVTLRLIQTAALLTGFVLLMHYRAVGAIFSYVAPLIWIWLVPLQTGELQRSGQLTRGLLACVLLLQFLHAYPIGGSQESWGTFLFIPLVALGLGDVRHWLTRRSVPDCGPVHTWSRLSLILVIVICAKVTWTFLNARTKYATYAPLDLPGAGRLHLPEPQRSTYRIISLNAVAHTDVLFSLPGMFSYNLWTGLPTPTTKNTTLWFSLLGKSEQLAIIQTLEHAPRPGLIVQESLLDIMRAGNIPMQGVLWDYLQQHFYPAFKSFDTAFWIKKGRVIAPINIASVRQRAKVDPAGRQEDSLLDFSLITDGSPIASIEVRTGMPVPTTVLTLNSANARIFSGPSNSSGQALAPPTPGSWPLKTSGLVHVLVYFNCGGLTLSPASTLLYLKSPAGEYLGEIALSNE